jgi:starch synthase
MRILQVSSELFPVLKTGGLADVAGALPAALGAQGCEVRALLPGFPAVCASLRHAQKVGSFTTPWGEAIEVVLGDLPGIGAAGQALKTYVLMAPGLYDRPGNPYHDSLHQPYADNHRRFAALGWGAAHLAYGLDAAWGPDLVHCHDWHAGLAPTCMAFWQSPRRVPTLFTIHNLAYQGCFDAACFADLGLPSAAFGVDGLEFYGQVSFMKGALVYADHISTVSPTYAREIQTPEQGFGLDGLLRRRAAQLSGILNGVDASVWDPAHDPLLPHTFDARRLAGKALNKAALQAETGLEALPDAPLFTLVGRLTEQKALPLVRGGIKELVQGGGQLLVLGSGDAALEQALAAHAQAHPGRMAVRLDYDEALAHRIFGGGDITLVPSRFEPCGLTQLYGLKYGSLPLVRRVGGLADTVVDTDLETLDNHSATGFVFDGFDAAPYQRALRMAFALYRRRADWNRVRQNGMRIAFGWEQSAMQYRNLYDSLVSPP